MVDESRILKRLVAVRSRVLTEATQLLEQWRPHLRRSRYAYSAFNAACYLALRRRDLRALQMALVPLGLSSLGRCEGHVLASLDAVIAALAAMCQTPRDGLPERPALRHFLRARSLLERHTRELLPKPAALRQVRIMVTLPVESATDYPWVRDLLKRGVDCVRINCAHDGEEEWLGMIQNVRRAERETRRRCTVLMDLCGPRARISEVRRTKRHRRVREGDRLWLGSAYPDLDEDIPFQALCSMPELPGQLARGAQVWINEGRIGARVRKKAAAGVVLEVSHALPKGERFRAEMGLNFPGAVLRVSPLTDKDLKDLDFVCSHADALSYSFVQEPEDMDRLALEIERRRPLRPGKRALGVVAKIETERAVRNLPSLIIRGAGRGPFGIMIARGDLAVEIGYLRIAEIQEEILWVCEAAHVPVIWATQVLESLAKKGVPSRAEITDAAMSERAECVMLNKGPFIPQAVSVLSDMLVCMQAHQHKKMATFRALRSWDHLWLPSQRKSTPKAAGKSA